MWVWCVCVCLFKDGDGRNDGTGILMEEISCAQGSSMVHARRQALGKVIQLPEFSSSLKYVQTYVRDVAGSFPDHYNEVSTQ